MRDRFSVDEPSATKRFEFAAASNDQGVRVDEFLMMRIGSLSRMRIRNLIADGRCTVNGDRGRAGQKLVSHDVVVLEVPEGPPTSMDPDPIPLEIIHEDEQIIVIVKPAGMLVHPTRGVKRGTLANALAFHMNRTGPGDTESFIRPGLVHRLDRVTSGLMVVARTQRSLVTLSRHFKRRLVERRYLAVVQGCVLPDQGVVNAPIGRDPDQLPHWRVLDSGRPAETRFRVIERGNDLTLVELEPVTGRTNQLRIHMALTGHPIVGDAARFEQASGPQTNVTSHPAVEGREVGFGRLGLRSLMLGNSGSEQRLLLHAWHLAFHHPANGEWVSFGSLPTSW